MQTKADARNLARAVVALGNQCGGNTRAILTDMDTPLGRTAGNWLEVKESVDCLEERGPADLRDLVIDCAAHLLVQTKKSKSLIAARKWAEACLNSGAPRAKWNEMLVAQGANIKAFNRKLLADSTASVILELKSPASGFVSRCDARIIGEVVRDLGAGRFTKESVINYDVGLDKIVKLGERVEKNSILARIHASTQAHAKDTASRLLTAFKISSKPQKVRPLISEVMI
jgi:pyrimidine-nucleoside phosphorylase